MNDPEYVDLTTTPPLLGQLIDALDEFARSDDVDDVLSCVVNVRARALELLIERAPTGEETAE